MSYAKIGAPGDYGDRFVVADHVDHLLEIEALGVKEMTTQMGPARAVNANIRDITDGTQFHDQLIFQSVLVGALSATIGQKVLAYLRVGVAAPGKTAPYLLIDASEDQDALAAAGAGQGATPARGSVPEGSDSVDAAVEALGGLLA